MIKRDLHDLWKYDIEVLLNQGQFENASRKESLRRPRVFGSFFVDEINKYGASNRNIRALLPKTTRTMTEGKFLQNS